MIDKVSDQTAAGDERAEGTRNRPLYSPPADIYETKDALVLLLEMPCVEPGSVNVTLDKRVLRVTGTCSPVVPSGCSLTHAEYRDGDYERAFTLSENIDGEGIAASLRHGLLKVILPKVKPAPAKSISVKAG